MVLFINTKEFSIKPRSRPLVLKGTTTKMVMECGKLYITLNKEKDLTPFEMFIRMGKAGGCAASQLEAIGRLISLCLRCGIDSNYISKHLKGIRCPSPIWEKGKGKIFSCADAISKVLKRQVTEQVTEEVK